MKTIIKILVVVVILNACVRVGLAYSTYYQLKDAALQLVTFGEKASPNEIQSQLIAKAADLKVPLDPADVDVHREQQHTTVSASYTQPVEVFPNFTYPINFKLSVDAFSMSGLGAAR